MLDTPIANITGMAKRVARTWDHADTGVFHLAEAINVWAGREPIFDSYAIHRHLESLPKRSAGDTTAEFTATVVELTADLEEISPGPARRVLISRLTEKCPELAGIRIDRRPAEEGPTTGPSIEEEVTLLANDWMADRQRELMRFTRPVNGAENLIGHVLAALIFNVRQRLDCGEGARSAVYGFTFGLQSDLVRELDNGNPTRPTQDCLLKDLMNALNTLSARGEPTLRTRFDGFLEADTRTQALVWNGVRAVTKPVRMRRVDATHLGDASSLGAEVGVYSPSGASLTELIAELNSFEGLDEVKRIVTNQMELQQSNAQRARAGLKVALHNRHMVFRGNPGTGKTTIARLIANIYLALGVLESGHLVETDRSGLVGEYLGVSALKTQKVVEASLGGVLFVDEAYALAGTADQPADRFAHEALATLVKAMEDHRDNLVVILAGYTSDMDNLLTMNAGLRSRIGTTIDFADYTTDELTEILSALFTKHDYDIDSCALTRMSDRIKQVERDDTFGNARLMRNVFETTVRAQASRIAAMLRTGTVDSAGTLRAITDCDATIALNEVLPVRTHADSFGFYNRSGDLNY